ncbi:pyridoxal phosphate-dependent aminotransferase [Pyramidobacter sp. SM-530-WT-4B]|uniref:Aminotransferase n=1 Tax=Pyramidobacter porci TaxID=2605789 RepID=A0A6L5Y911_9BACT|nr:pyridoxal phosphate-dependent aminotransferase [Pyramidobacter porci]MST54790.1 pyridoxal phosphate-dependent aminotransferase [Pyramidobacter porci]
MGELLSTRVRGISPSATEQTSALANRMRRKGIDVLSFAQGEPDFDTPDNIKQVAIKAIREGFTKYTDVPGIPALLQAVQTKLKRANGVEYDMSEIVVNNGGKQALYEVFQALCEPGDVVLIPTPGYVSYVEQIKLTGAEPVYVPSREEDGFKLTVDQVKTAWTPAVKLFVMNSPCNPTGAMYTADELRAIAEFLVSKGVTLIADEVYENFVYDGGKSVCLASLSPEIKAHTVIVNSLSKTYAMTGWRVGYAAGPKDIISAVINLQGHVSGNINSIAQKAAIEALLGPQDSVLKMLAEFARRREYMYSRICAMPQLSCVKPEGAFYMFVNVKKIFGKSYDGVTIATDIDAAKFFIEKGHVAVVPGAAFGCPGYVRLVFAKSMDMIREGMDRMEKALKAL